MPREQTNSERLSGIKSPAKLIIIASEGIRAEPQYFKALDRACDQNIVRPFVLKKAPSEQGHSAPEHVLTQMRVFKKSESLKPDDEFWIILDVDAWPNLEEIIAEAAKENIQCAVSNKCFELWLLLHLIDVSSLSNDQQADLLRNLKISNNHTYTSELMGKKMKEVLNANWSKNRTNAARLMPYVDDAVRRAKTMTSNEAIPEGLGSTVYRIVEKIRIG